MGYRRNYQKFIVLLLLLIGSNIMVSASPDLVNIEVPYVSYIFDYWGDTMQSPLPYLPEEVYNFLDSEAGKLSNPQDLYVSDDNIIYIADTGNNRLICLDEKFEISRIITGFENHGEFDTFKQPTGVFVDNYGHIYIADKENQRVVKLDSEGNLVQIIGHPEPEVEGILPEDFRYRPTKLVVDKASLMYVLCDDVYEGLLQFDRNGEFQGFIGAPKVRPNILDRIWKWLSTEEQQDRRALFLPTEYYNIDINERGFIYATVSSTDVEEDAIRQLNPSGEDVLRRNGFFAPIGDIYWPDTESTASITGPSLLVDICVQDYGIYYALDSRRGRVFAYDNNGNLLFVFGYNTDKYGAVKRATAIDTLGDNILILDAEKGFLNVYSPTEYVNYIMGAIKHHYIGEYDIASEMWYGVLKMNVNNDLAYTGIGKAFMRQDNFKEAMVNFKLGNNRDDYSDALRLYRRELVGRNFGWIVSITVVLSVIISILKRIFGNRAGEQARMIGFEKASKDNKFFDLLEKLRYSLYLIFHPFDGFWDLKYEKRGSLPAATIILSLVCLTYVFMRQYTGFIFNHLDPSKLNIITEFLSVLIPFLLWCIVNFSLTTLMEGKGKFVDVFISSCYALTPIVVINIPATIMSHFITMEEGAFYYIFLAIAWTWAAFLLFFGTMVTHHYDIKKNFFTTVFTIAGMVFIIFLSVLFFNLVEQIYIFVSEIYHEIIYRI
ncbi:MAG: hypothetical protein GX175_02570 [Halanaerobiaceae bacterium]|nr:hypothetical protein [Halanaerobiaceae bacterium]